VGGGEWDSALLGTNKGLRCVCWVICGLWPRMVMRVWCVFGRCWSPRGAERGVTGCGCLGYPNHGLVTVEKIVHLLPEKVLVAMWMWGVSRPRVSVFDGSGE
jgi:hypothetical protein